MNKGSSILHLSGIEILQPEARGDKWEILIACSSKEEMIALDWEMGQVEALLDHTHPKQSFYHNELRAERWPEAQMPQNLLTDT